MKLFILQLFQYLEDIDDPVRCEIVIHQQSACLPAGIAPADADPSGSGEGLELRLIVLHMGQKERVDVLDGHHIVDAALFDSQRSLGIGNL